MVNTVAPSSSTDLHRVSLLVSLYVAISVATLAVLAVLAATGSTGPDGATTDAWVHAAIVGAFAVLLPMRLAAARRGSDGARRALVVIATVLVVVNLVEAALPGTFPGWMRVEMVVIALLMGATAITAARAR